MKKTYLCRVFAALLCLVTLLASVSCKQKTPVDDYWSTWQDSTADTVNPDTPEDSTQAPAADRDPEIELIYAENVNRVELWESGSVASSSGKPMRDPAHTRIRTKDFFDTHRLGVIRSEKLEFTLCAYGKETGGYIGAWTGSSFSTKNIIFVDLFRDFDLCAEYNIKLIARMKDGTTLAPEDAVDIECLPILEGRFDALENGAWSGGITFIEESGSMEAVRHWEQIADACGIRVAFAVETGKIGTPGYVTWNEMMRLQSRGFTFLARPNGDLAVGEVDAALLEADLAATVAAFAEHHIENRFFFCSEGLDADGLAIVKQYFQAVVTAGDSVNAMPLDTYRLNAYSYTDPDAVKELAVGEETHTVHAPRGADELHALLNSAAGHDSWVIFKTNFENDYANGNYCDEDMLQSVIDLCCYAAQKGMRILSFDEGYDHFKNRLEIGSLADGEYYIVDHNGKVHEGTTEAELTPDVPDGEQ